MDKHKIHKPMDIDKTKRDPRDRFQPVVKYVDPDLIEPPHGTYECDQCEAMNVISAKPAATLGAAGSSVVMLG
ncbi:hypothetical protein SUGI_0433020 [Cryptomeria japonica]|nr:hypothetical protein SUGI_0433020 [Cryptomeria japonica]